MGRPPLSSYSPEVAAKMRAEISARMLLRWKERLTNGYGTRSNGALQVDVQKQIAASVKARWADGTYANRVNGMAGKTGAAGPRWTWGKRQYDRIHQQHWPDVECERCGENKQPTNVHHVDEDHGNYLLSNLIRLCVPCHAWHHYPERRQPFIVITKRFPFEYAHVLPWHPGKCGQLHGHSGQLTVELRARLDPNGVVMDYYDVGQVVKLAIIDRLDHRLLNDFIPNPTSEEFVVFAWIELELAGLKALSSLRFSETASTEAVLTKADMIEAFGWTRDRKGKFSFVQKTVAEFRP